VPAEMGKMFHKFMACWALRPGIPADESGAVL
jgi:hypothetical protein